MTSPHMAGIRGATTESAALTIFQNGRGRKGSWRLRSGSEAHRFSIYRQWRGIRSMRLKPLKKLRIDEGVIGASPALCSAEVNRRANLMAGLLHRVS